MSPFYKEVCNDLGWSVNEDCLAYMLNNSRLKLKALNVSLANADKSKSEKEVSDIMLKKAEFYSSIGAKELALAEFRQLEEKTLSLGDRLDIIFHQSRIGFFYLDHTVVKRSLQTAQKLIEECSSDLTHKDKLNVYRGMYCLSVRDFKMAACLFLDSVETFTSYELMDYQAFVQYTVYCCIIALSRPELQEKVVRCSLIMDCLQELPDIQRLLLIIDGCRYADYFAQLAKLEALMKHDRYLAPHRCFYERALTKGMYTHFLESNQQAFDDLEKKESAPKRRRLEYTQSGDVVEQKDKADLKGDQHTISSQAMEMSLSEIVLPGALPMTLSQSEVSSDESCLAACHRYQTLLTKLYQDLYAALENNVKSQVSYVTT